MRLCPTLWPVFINALKGLPGIRSHKAIASIKASILRKHTLTWTHTQRIFSPSHNIATHSDELATRLCGWLSGILPAGAVFDADSTTHTNFICCLSVRPSRNRSAIYCVASSAFSYGTDSRNFSFHSICPYNDAILPSSDNAISKIHSSEYYYYPTTIFLRNHGQPLRDTFCKHLRGSHVAKWVGYTWERLASIVWKFDIYPTLNDRLFYLLNYSSDKLSIYKTNTKQKVLSRLGDFIRWEINKTM